MYMYAKYDQTIPSGYKVMRIQQRQNHHQRADSSESYWLPKYVMTPNLWILLGFFQNTNVLSSNRGFLSYAKHYHRETNYQ